MVIAPSASDLESSKSWVRSISETVPRPSQRGHIPPVRVNVALTVLLAPRSIVIAPLARTEGTLKENAFGRADVRLPEPAEEDAQHRVGVGGGADRGAGVGTHPLLVGHGRCRQ